jgi:transposase
MQTVTTNWSRHRKISEQILELDRMIMAWYRSNETSRRLHYIPGVGPLLATALVANVADPGTFRSGRTQDGMHRRVHDDISLCVPKIGFG